jgi:heme-degrading monooxygenase HmoA
MNDGRYQLAQVNIGRMLGPIDGPVMADFVARLDEINALAESAPGFVWRLTGEENNATSLRPYEDEMIIINISVWENLDSLYEFTYYSNHVEVFRRRKEWFSKMPIYMTMWYVHAGHIPTPQEAKAKLEHLEHYGPTPLAFTFRQPFTVEEMLAYTPMQAE